MKEYPYFEKKKELLGMADMTVEDIIKTNIMTEETIAAYNEKFSQTKEYETTFPIGYAYAEDKTVHYYVHLSENFQLLREMPVSSALLDFVAQDTENTLLYLNKLSDNITQLIKLKQTDNKDLITLDINEIIDEAIKTVLIPLHHDNFFLFLTACAFLQFDIELTIYSFYPYIALEHYEKLLGTTFDRDCDAYKSLSDSYDGSLYNTKPFEKAAIYFTTEFLSREKELLSHDLDTLAGTQTVMLDNTSLQKLYLLESQKKFSSNYINTNFNVHLMPVGIHGNSHHSIVEKIVLENMEVKEVYDLNSIHDWYRYEFISLVKGNVLFKKCQCCGNFFIPTKRSDSEYCDRMNPEYGKSCKEVGAAVTFAKRHENDEIHRAYTKAYRRMDSRKRTHYISKNEFNKWSTNAREKRTLCENGEITLEEFQAWLDESRCR